MPKFEKGQSGNPKGRPKGATGVKTDLTLVYKKLFSEPIIKKDKDGNVVKKIKLTPEQQILASLISMYRDPKTPIQIRAKVAGDLLGYLYTKPTQSIELSGDIEQTVTDNSVKNKLDKLTPEQREAYLELCESVNNTKEEGDASDSE